MSIHKYVCLTFLQSSQPHHCRGRKEKIILEESPKSPTVHQETMDQPLHLLALSAKSDVALIEIAESYAKFASDYPSSSLADIAYTTIAGRSHFQHRLALIARDTQELKSKLDSGDYLQNAVIP